VEGVQPWAIDSRCLPADNPFPSNIERVENHGTSVTKSDLIYRPRIGNSPGLGS
jgi:hypothetical protein